MRLTHRSGIAQKAPNSPVGSRLPEIADTWQPEWDNATSRANLVANQQMLNYRLHTLRRAALGPWIVGVWLIGVLFMLWRLVR